MAFPTSPSNGDTYKGYVYNSTNSVWNKMDPEKSYPVGYIYVQYPGKDDPSTLGWYGTWANKSSEFAGDFFRTEGGDASTFESGQQTDLIKDHDHTMRVFNQNAGAWSTDQVFTNGYFQYTGTFGNAAQWQTFGGPTGAETRPVNRTIRIWERTA